MKLGIIICDRYKICEGGKCFRSIYNREGAFKRYKIDDSLDVVAYTTCGGCPGGNIENAVKEFVKYGAQSIHFATGVLAGYPPCYYLDDLKKYVKEQTGLPVVIGTHPMPRNYIEMHKKLDDWSDSHKMYLSKFQLIDPDESIKYDSSSSDYTVKLQKELQGDKN